MYSHAVLTFAMLSCAWCFGLDCGARSCCAELGCTNLLDLAVLLVTQIGLATADANAKLPIVVDTWKLIRLSSGTVCTGMQC